MIKENKTCSVGERSRALALLNAAQVIVDKGQFIEQIEYSNSNVLFRNNIYAF